MKRIPVDAFDLQAVEEALRTGIVVAVALRAHAASQTMGADQLLVSFPEKVREALLALAWWEMPMDWIKLYNEAFLVKLANIDESQALDLLALLQEAKQIAHHATPASD